MPADQKAHEVLTVTDLRTRTSEIIQRVSKGETFVVRHYNTLVATIVPPFNAAPSKAHKETRMTHAPTTRPVTAVLYNQAGGSCKTSLVRDLAYDAGQRGLRVLAIDADPQGSLTRWLGGYEELDVRGKSQGMRPERTIYDIISGRSEELPDPMHLHGIDLIPGNTTVEGAAVLLAMRGNEYMVRLRDAIDRLGDRYDLVLIDTPPADNALVTTCMVAADLVFTPVTASKGLDRVDTIMQAMKQARVHNPGLTFGGFIPSGMNLRAAHFKEVVYQMEVTYAQLGPTFRAIPARPALFNDAAANMMPVAVYKPSDPVIADLRELALQVLAVLGFEPEPDATEPEAASAEPLSDAPEAKTQAVGQ